MTSRQKRHLRKQLAAQVESDRIARANGATLDDLIPGDIAARMTQPKAPDVLYQVVVERRGALPIPVGPAAPEATAGKLRDAIRSMILAGKERDWFNPQVFPVIAGHRQPMRGLVP